MTFISLGASDGCGPAKLRQAWADEGRPENGLRPRFFTIRFELLGDDDAEGSSEVIVGASREEKLIRGAV